MRSYDEVFNSVLERNGDRMVRALTQPTQDLILNRNAELRKNPGALKDLTFGRQVASIPFLDYLKIKKDYPDLDKMDGKSRSALLLKILNKPENRHYLVRDHV